LLRINSSKWIASAISLAMRMRYRCFRKHTSHCCVSSNCTSPWQTTSQRSNSSQHQPAPNGAT
jgi:hypothetical protein